MSLIIKVKNRRKRLIATLDSGSVAFRGEDGIHVTVAKLANTVTISADSYGKNDIGEAVYQEVTANPYLSAVCGVSGTNDGAFFINGSGCWDWTVRTIGSAMEELRPELHLNDLCATCTSCAETLKLKKLVEFYKLAYTGIKDVNLSAESVQQEHQSYLQQRRLEVSASCLDEMKSLDLDDDLDQISGVFELDNVRLLGQYLAAVHMWNYAVSEMGREDKVTSIPDSQYGFGISTRGLMPACDGLTDITCTIQQSQVSGQSGLSLYVPEVSFSFSPGGTDKGSPMVSNVTYSNATTTTITLSRAAGGSFGRVVGAWNVVVKWIPFYYAVNKDCDERVVDVVSEIEPCVLKKEITTIPSGGVYVTYGNLELTQSIEQITNPTRDQYQKSQCYFSKASLTKNRWCVRVTWTLSGGINHTTTDTYYMETAGVRELVLADVMDSITIWKQKEDA